MKSQCYELLFQVYRVPVYVQNHRLVVDISLNRQDNAMIVSTSTSNLPKDFMPTANYHDFNTVSYFISSHLG